MLHVSYYLVLHLMGNYMRGRVVHSSQHFLEYLCECSALNGAYHLLRPRTYIQSASYSTFSH